MRVHAIFVSRDDVESASGSLTGLKEKYTTHMYEIDSILAPGKESI